MRTTEEREGAKAAMATRTRKMLIWMSSAVILGLAVLLLARPSPAPISPPPVKEDDSAGTEPPKPTQKPKIDVVIEQIDVPSHVKRGQSFELTIVLKNNSVGSQVAGVANVDIRAALQSPTGATNIFIASMPPFRQLRPGVPQPKTQHVTAPDKPGMWQAEATVKPWDYIDDANNSRNVTLIVD